MDPALQVPIACLVFSCTALVIIAIQLGLAIREQMDIATDRTGGSWIDGKEGLGAMKREGGGEEKVQV